MAYFTCFVQRQAWRISDVGKVWVSRMGRKKQKLAASSTQARGWAWVSLTRNEDSSYLE